MKLAVLVHRRVLELGLERGKELRLDLLAVFCTELCISGGEGARLRFGFGTRLGLCQPVVGAGTVVTALSVAHDGVWVGDNYSI